MEDQASSILVEVRPNPDLEGNLAGGKLTEKFAKRVDELGESLGEIANGLRDQLATTLDTSDDRGWGLDEVKLSFSLDLEAEGGVIVAKGKAAAGFEASLTWTRRPLQL